MSLARGYWGGELKIFETKDYKLRAEPMLDQYFKLYHKYINTYL